MIIHLLEDQYKLPVISRAALAYIMGSCNELKRVSSYASQ